MGEDKNTDRIYSFGYSPAAVGIMENRSAAANAGFLLGYLKPGMEVLDLGCGPGSITVGLADVVSPGNVVGIDIEPSQTALGRHRAETLGLKNCRFETASVLKIPLEENSVDVVYGHTILMQFAEPEPVLAEVGRVLKPGGLVGFREIDLGASLYHSDDSAMKVVMSTLRRSILHNGGYPDIGRSLPELLSRAGFTVLSASAVYTCASTPEVKAGMYAAMAGLWEQAEFVDQAESLGWVSAQDRAIVRERLNAEAKEPGSINGTTYVEVAARL